MDEEEAQRVLTGSHFQNGNWACFEGAMAAGLTSFYGYPITPSSEILEYASNRLKPFGDAFRQLEDEIASIIACIGASWAGGKAMTATSGPGFSLMQEGIGLASFTETPLMITNSQRAGPSTGIPTAVAQGDIMQCAFGSHGDYMNVTIAPASVQECFDLTVDGFNISERLRVPVIMLLDQSVSASYEKIEIPPAEKIEIYNRPKTPTEALSDLVPPMPCFGEGKNAFSTGLSHDRYGLPSMDPDNYDSLIKRLFRKVISHEEILPEPITVLTDDAETLLVAIGSVARVAEEAVLYARSKGDKIGLFRLRTIWPFPYKTFNRLLSHSSIERVVVIEMNMGQLFYPVKTFAPLGLEVISKPIVHARPARLSDILRDIGVKK
ncbi:MAG: 2-oxoacid:acceptor oxidoreductase subunit alpha [Candidatus Hodarchaeota archaeon]